MNSKSLTAALATAAGIAFAPVAHANWNNDCGCDDQSSQFQTYNTNKTNAEAAAKAAAAAKAEADAKAAAIAKQQQEQAQQQLNKQNTAVDVNSQNKNINDLTNKISDSGNSASKSAATVKDSGNSESKSAASVKDSGNSTNKISTSAAGGSGTGTAAATNSGVDNSSSTTFKSLSLTPTNVVNPVGASAAAYSANTPCVDRHETVSRGYSAAIFVIGGAMSGETTADTNPNAECLNIQADAQVDTTYIMNGNCVERVNTWTARHVNLVKERGNGDFEAGVQKYLEACIEKKPEVVVAPVAVAAAAPAAKQEKKVTPPCKPHGVIILPERVIPARTCPAQTPAP